MKIRLSIAIVALALSACGGGSSVGPAVVPVTSPSPSASGNTIFSIVVPNPPSAGASSLEHRAYVSPASQSVVVTLNGKTLVVGNVSITSSSCTPGASARTCTITANAPAGNDLFTIAAYDQPNGTGNVLSSGALSVTVGSSPSTVPVTMMNGVVAKIALIIASPYPPAGTSTTTNVSIQAFDADGATILGTYSQPVTITDQDKSGITTLTGSPITSSSGAQALTYSGAPFHSTALTATVGTLEATAPFAPEPTITNTYTTPTIDNGPFPGIGNAYGLWSLIVGPDGNIWSAGSMASVIVEFARNGSETPYNMPDSFSDPQGITSGPDGRIWIAQWADGTIGAMTTNGAFSQYVVPAGSGISEPADVTAGPDGNIYATDQGLPAILQITPSGSITVFPLPSGSYPQDLVTGPDGNLWISDDGTMVIEVMSTSGHLVATYPLSQTSRPYGITVGPDSNVWFTEFGTDRIGRITTHGVLTEFALPTPYAGPTSIVTGPDGNLWFAEAGGSPDVYGKFGYITPTGSTIRDYVSTLNMHLYDLVFDSTGTLWTTDGISNFGYGVSDVSTIIY